jgi:hypothetical protein
MLRGVKKGVLGIVVFGALAFAGGDNGTVDYTNGSSGYKTGGFFGVRGSYVFSIKSSQTWLGNQYVDDNYDGSGGSFGAQIGGQEGQWRATLAYEYFDNNDDQNYDLFLGQIDYFFMSNPDAIRPYLGLDLGWLNYETSGTDDKNGMAYGGSLGVAVPVGENFELDLSARYLFATQDEVDHIGSVNFSINYYY